jgi:hypothetical protein
MMPSRSHNTSPSLAPDKGQNLGFSSRPSTPKLRPTTRTSERPCRQALAEGRDHLVFIVPSMRSHRGIANNRKPSRAAKGIWICSARSPPLATAIEHHLTTASRRRLFTCKCVAPPRRLPWHHQKLCRCGVRRQRRTPTRGKCPRHHLGREDKGKPCCCQQPGFARPRSVAPAR